MSRADREFIDWLASHKAPVSRDAVKCARDQLAHVIQTGMDPATSSLPNACVVDRIEVGSEMDGDVVILTARVPIRGFKLSAVQLLGGAIFKEDRDADK
jgi:hypothetical protein